MRLVSKKTCLVLLLALMSPRFAHGQNPDTIAPEESEARAKKILNQLIQGLGGQTFLGMRERQWGVRRKYMSPHVFRCARLSTSSSMTRLWDANWS